METKYLKKRYPDLTTVKLIMDAVYSRRDIIDKLKASFGNTIVRYEQSGKKVNVATSIEFGKFVDQLVPGVKVIMTGGDIDLNPAYKGKVWTITTHPQLMCSEVVVWLDGFSGAYSAEMSRFPHCDEDLPF